MRLFYLLFIYIIGFGLSSCEDELQNWIDGNPIIQESMKLNPEQGEVCLIPTEEMPRFPGCEDPVTIEVRKACADKKMLEFIYTNIIYPKSLDHISLESKVLISFIVEKDGSLSNFKIIRGTNEILNNEVLRVAQMMPEWIPGRHRGRPVAVKFHLPLKFKLE
ncbi:MAG: TonB family protein [Saprospiraceae bacterium]|nr:TonB family protein [Saprospiraceae bacterium]